MNTNQLLGAALLATSIGAPISGFAGDAKVPQPVISTGIRVPFLHGLVSGQISGQSEMASLERANDWLNSPPLTPAALSGKVVLIDFWTYTCINWLRTAPYVRAWAEKYKEQGLVVIGVHAPEFSFEKQINNVRWAVKEMRIDYPGDATNDPSQPWPSDRKVVELGVLTLDKVVPNSPEAQKKLLFLPGQITDGIEASDDPMIAVRDGAYAVSFSRRNP
jgi:thiol-disulfide isomerase/thioredoxin